MHWTHYVWCIFLFGKGKGIAQRAIRLCEEKHGNDGNWKPFCRNSETVIYMRKWAIVRRVKQKSLAKDLH